MDLHGNIDDTMAAQFEVMLGFHLFPHEDQLEGGNEAMRLVPALNGRALSWIPVL